LGDPGPPHRGTGAGGGGGGGAGAPIGPLWIESMMACRRLNFLRMNLYSRTSWSPWEYAKCRPMLCSIMSLSRLPCSGTSYSSSGYGSPPRCGAYCSSAGRAALKRLSPAPRKPAAPSSTDAASAASTAPAIAARRPVRCAARLAASSPAPGCAVMPAAAAPSSASACPAACPAAGPSAATIAAAGNAGRHPPQCS